LTIDIKGVALIPFVQQFDRIPVCAPRRLKFILFLDFPDKLIKPPLIPRLLCRKGFTLGQVALVKDRIVVKFLDDFVKDARRGRAGLN